MSQKHSDLLKEASEAVSHLPGVHCRMFRNEVGQGVAGKIEAVTKAAPVMLYPGDYIVRRGHRVTYGLLVGSGDEIGYTAVTITPEHVGQRLAVFTSFEGKTKTDRLRPEQRVWHDNVQAAGGISVEVRSVDDAVSAILKAAGKKAG